MTLGGAAAAGVRLIVWCRGCQHRVEPDPTELARRYDAETRVLEWHASGQNQTDDTQSGRGFSLQRAPMLTSPREAGLERFYEGAESLFVRAYDAFYAGGTPPIAGDIAFYDRLAQATGGPVLELGCGTGRIALALAQAGLSVTGVDVSAGMLVLARRKSERLAAAASRCLTFVEGDMARLDVGRRFGMAFIAFRSFQHLLTVDEQRATLTGVRRHLRPDGRLALHLFDPRFDLLADENPPAIRQSGIDPATQRRYAGEILRTGRDYLNQIRHDLWRYAETDLNGTLLEEATREMALRWTYRWELRHLLELSGFVVEAEYSDFHGAPPAYGKELVLVARRETNLRKRVSGARFRAPSARAGPPLTAD